MVNQGDPRLPTWAVWKLHVVGKTIHLGGRRIVQFGSLHFAVPKFPARCTGFLDSCIGDDGRSTQLFHYQNLFVRNPHMISDSPGLSSWRCLFVTGLAPQNSSHHLSTKSNTRFAMIHLSPLPFMLISCYYCCILIICNVYSKLNHIKQKVKP